MTNIRIEYPKDNDWLWITEKYVETAWASLIPELRQAITLERVHASLAEQTVKLRAEHGATNQAFIARVDGKDTGYVWVGHVKSGFTGAMQAHILNLFVADEFRGQGIGLRLMTSAETWARQHKLERIGLSVAMHNKAAICLYEHLEYKVEMLRMFKSLAD